MIEERVSWIIFIFLDSRVEDNGWLVTIRNGISDVLPMTRSVKVFELGLIEYIVCEGVLLFYFFCYKPSLNRCDNESFASPGCS